MKALKAIELKRLRSNLIASAELSVSKFVSENKMVLPQYVELTVEKVKARDKKGTKEAAYQLCSAAKSFNRPDLTNIAEILFKTMDRPKYAQEDTIFQVFELALITLSNNTLADKETEDEVTKGIYEALKKINSR